MSRHRATNEPIRALFVDDPIRSLFGGERVPEVHIFGQTVDIWIEVNASEAERRTAAGVGAMPDEELIRSLMGVPEGMPVSSRALDGRVLLAMERLLDVRAVEFEGDSFLRRAIPPVRIVGIAKAIGRWSDVWGVTLLRTHGPRIAVAERPMARRIIREVDPDVGVVMRRGDALDLLRPPGTRALRPSWQRWVIAETAYGAWLSMGGHAPLERHRGTRV